MFNKIIKNINNENIKSYKRVLGTSITCLSIAAFSLIGMDAKAYATTTVSQSQEMITVVQVVEQVEEPVIEPEEISLGAKIEEEALKYIGINYVSGGNTPESGFDCSGFTRYVFNNSGINLPRIAQQQSNVNTLIASGYKAQVIDKKDVQAGDLLFFGNNINNIGHVGIALSDDKFIHASSSKQKILVASRAKDDGYYFNQSCIRVVRISK